MSTTTEPLLQSPVTSSPNFSFFKWKSISIDPFLINNRFINCTACLLLLITLAPALSSAQYEDKIDRIDSVLTFLHQNELFNGAILIADKGEVIYRKAFGTKNIETNEMLTTSSAFNLASVSKQFYTMLVMILKEQGKLSLDDPVREHLPSFPYPDIAIRHLMNQTSGLPEYFDMAGGDMNLMDTLTNASLLKLISSRKPDLVFQPGDQWQYSNTNYTTLASLIESVSGTRIDLLFQELIARPLQLNDTYVYNLKLDSYPPSRVFGFGYEGGKGIPRDLVRFDGIVGDGNIYSSVEDLFKWDQSLYTDQLVSQSTMAEAFAPGILNSGDSTRYGFGWGINKPGKIVSHTGGWVGFRTIIVRYIDVNQTLIVLDNSSNYHALLLPRNIWEDRPYTLPKSHLITNVNVIDGTGLPPYPTNVRILDSQIRDMGPLSPYVDEEVTDGKGLVLAPGFIDSHSHHDWGLEENPSCIAATNQGITTIVIGQDGSSVPIDSIKVRIKRKPISVNIASYTGHASLRRQFMDDVLRKATDIEIDSMKTVLARELDKGSLGLSTGLEYEPAFYSNRDEVVALAKVASSKGGRYISHIRSEDLHQEEAIEEIIAIGQKADLPVQISHLKIAKRGNWGSSSKLLRQLEQARLDGIDITADVYPYVMWSSTPRVLFPKKDFENLASAEFATSELFDPASSTMIQYPPNKSYEGKTVSEIAALNGESDAQTLLRIIRETSPEGMGGSIVATSMSEEDVQNFLKWPHSNICSDGAIGGHPRGHGSFSRVLGKYVREQQLMSLHAAIQKMTSLAAEHVGIHNRGLITPGYFADLVLFDPDAIIDNATIENPTALSDGVLSVWVNGKMVYQNQKAVDNYPGRFLGRGN